MNQITVMRAYRDGLDPQHRQLGKRLAAISIALISAKAGKDCFKTRLGAMFRAPGAESYPVERPILWNPGVHRGLFLDMKKMNHKKKAPSKPIR